MSIPCRVFSHLNICDYSGLSYVLETSKAIKHPNTAIQTSKYHVNPMLEAQSFQYMETILDYPMFLIRHRPSNVQIQRFKRSNIVSIPCWRFSHSNTWRIYRIILPTRHVIGHQKSKYSDSNVQISCQSHAGGSVI